MPIYELTNMNFSIRRLPLLRKINAIVALVFLVVTGVETFFSAQNSKAQYLRVAEEQVNDLTTMYFDSLNTMMLTGSMNQRNILRERLLARDKVLEAKVIRGDSVVRQFGAGFAEEQGGDELDRLALAGQTAAIVNHGDNGRELTVVTPLKATTNTRGVNCMDCHNVEPGDISGAIRLKFSLAHMDAEIESEILRNMLSNLALFFVGMLLVNALLRHWLTNPVSQLLAAVQKRAQGDISVRVKIENHDEIGRLGEAFNMMAENVNAVTAREHDRAVDLERKVDSLRAVMKKVTEGDFSVKVGFYDDSEIGELATSLQVMIDKLKQSIDEKHATVENLQTKVDRILNVTDLVAGGDLTGAVQVEGEDAIAQLARGVQGMIESLNSLVTQIQHSGAQVNYSSTELSSCMSTIANTAERQAETTHGLSLTATEISSTIRELLHTMDDVADMADSTTSSAVHSHSGLKKLGVLIQQVVASAEIVSEKLEILDERARNIGAVVVTIAKVADQTNLLSLNAALEAEKAGEYGRGFAVVAMEIRRLADLAAISTLDIEQMIKEMQESVSSGVKTMKGFTDLVRSSVDEVGQVRDEQSEIISLVETMGPRFEALHQAMQSQSQGAEQIHVAMNQLNEEAQKTVASLRTSAKTFTLLNESSEQLQNSVSKFKVLKK
ncbi:MAG TPA: methyl-accepting chemotaxis protein [Gammaproteobacteria bacterium]|nr:methyl-accepting chemotaxis protein [Gammaproteobacteria bacterium]